MNDMDHDSSTNEHDDFEEELDYFSYDDEADISIPRVIRRPLTSRESIMSDITGVTELEQQTEELYLSRRVTDALSEEQPRIGIDPVSRVLDRSYFQKPTFREAEPNHGCDETREHQSTNRRISDERFAHASVPARASYGQEDHYPINIYQANRVSQGEKGTCTKDASSLKSLARKDSVRKGEKVHQASEERMEESDMHEYAPSDSNAASNIETILGNGDVILANAYRVDTMPLVTATPMLAYDESSSQNSKPRKARVIKKTIIKKRNETKRDSGGSLGSYLNAEATQNAVRKTTTFSADGSCTIETIYADGTTTTTIKHSTKGKGKKGSSKSTKSRTGSANNVRSTASSASSAMHSHPNGGDARSHASSSGSHSASSKRSDPSSGKRSIKSRITKESADGTRVETIQYTDGTVVTRTSKITKPRKRRS